jgi:gluconolactonase
VIEARVPAFRQVVSPGAEIVQILTGMGSLRGIVCSRTGIVSFADVARDILYEYAIPRWQTAPGGGVLRQHPLGPKGAFGLTLDHQGRLLIAGHDPAGVTRIAVDGTAQELTRSTQAGHPQHPADLVYAIDGNIYVAELPDESTGGENSESGAVFQITRSGTVRPASSIPLRPTGVALDCRQLHLLVADELMGGVQRFPIAADGSLGTPTTVFKRPVSHELSGGVETDEEGNIYVAAPDGVWVYNVDGTHLGMISLPESPSDLCWGRGAIGLYVTAENSIYFIPTEVRGTRTF